MSRITWRTCVAHQLSEDTLWLSLWLSCAAELSRSWIKAVPAAPLARRADQDGDQGRTPIGLLTGPGSGLNAAVPAISSNSAVLMWVARSLAPALLECLLFLPGQVCDGEDTPRVRLYVECDHGLG